ncbi:MAG: hypothetical protein V4675_14875 [Verrucomicrobiota bacterium]
MISEWAKFYPEGWKFFLVEGKPLGSHALETRRDFQRSQRNGQIEQAALDASLVQEIMERLHHDLDDFEGAPCGDITKWASKL